MCFFLHRLRSNVVGIGVNQHQPRNLAHVPIRKGAYDVATKGMADQNVLAFYTGFVQRTVQLIGDPHAGARHGTGVAEPSPGAIIAACARPLRNRRLHDRPGGRPVFPTRFKHDRGGAASHAVEI